MMHSEEKILERLEEESGSGAIRVSKFLHLMMDVDSFFEGSRSRKYTSTYEFVAQQIPNFQILNERHKDKLIGFVAFNPARSNGLEVVKNALANGFQGVKFYPPLGYRATENEDRIFETRIAELLAYCDQKNVPVFTHCNNAGFEAHPRENSGYNASPVFWEKVLARHEKLRLCLGHAGGIEGWFCDNRASDKITADEIDSGITKDDSKAQEMDWNSSYAALVFRLCVKFDNVYCDASYLDEMVTPNGNLLEKEEKNFRERLVKLFQSESKFSRKIMYGSDWHMLFKDAKNKTFFPSYVKFFEHPDLSPYADDFFEKNAKRFLNI